MPNFYIIQYLYNLLNDYSVICYRKHVYYNRILFHRWNLPPVHDSRRVCVRDVYKRKLTNMNIKDAAKSVLNISSFPLTTPLISFFWLCSICSFPYMVTVSCCHGISLFYRFSLSLTCLWLTSSWCHWVHFTLKTFSAGRRISTSSEHQTRTLSQILLKWDRGKGRGL